MKDILTKLKLVDYFTTEVPIQQAEFVARFQNSVDEGDTGIFSGAFDMFSSSKNEYRGHVYSDGFKIKRKRKFFDANMSLAVAEGRFTQQEQNVVIATEINGFSGLMIPFFGFILVFYAIFLIGFLFSASRNGSQTFVALPFIFLHASFMLGIPYFIMRRGVSKMKHELEREFYYMTKK
ncbi:hypothetical protein [Hymenobacter chitinivorans]|uniref:Uncharacterized protein n=1 Tax=Hymenobacter chitinivorans DSM 11115 TaxID=1121954 RepID=A0A2M9BMT1_9BACT|nr:hypothetical protein [Hymenobacter chitinivorans]PJJ59249.1 hypothetical protein CLV45_0665 [Hymenobacter chitinivorans DSM 11115]